MEKTEEIKRYLKFQRKLRALKLAEDLGCKYTCDAFNISKTTFYNWKRKYEKYGEKGLCRKKRESSSYWNSFDQKTINLRRNNVKPLDRTTTRRAMGPKRYSKETPGHHVQIDVKFLTFNTKKENIRRFQYTAIDDCTRIRAIKIYEKHNQECAIDFLNYVVGKFPFRIHTIQTDNGHEFQSKFNWHVQDKGMNHRYIKPGKPQHNGKVERSHLTDQREFYQLLSFTDDVDLNEKLNQWEDFYNFNRPHGAFNGKTPYEKLKCLLKN